MEGDGIQGLRAHIRGRWTSYGGYATTIPSKYISADGRTMWLQSNVCPCADAGVSIYDFSLRPLTLSIDPVDPPVGW